VARSLGLHLLGRRGAEVLALGAIALFFVNFDSQTLWLALPTVAHQFHAAVPALTDMASVVAVGALLGLPLSMLADRVGRRRMLLFAILGVAVTNLAAGFAPSLVGLTLIRTLGSCCETTAGGVALTLVVEEVPSELRGLSVSVLTIAAGLGTGLTTILWPLLTPDWRALYLIGGAGLIGLAILAWRLQESVAWRTAHHDKLSLRVLFFESRWRKRILVTMAVALFGSLFFQPAGSFTVLFGAHIGLSAAARSAVIVVAGVLSVPAFVVGGRLSDRWGRRWLAVGLGLATAIAAGATFLGGVVLYWVGNVVWSIIASASSPVIGAWYGELFPTRARATAEAANSVAGSAGGVAGLQLVGLLSPMLGLGHTLVLCVVAPLIAALLLLLLAETRAEPLPE
jgi:MFS family permease